MATVGEILLSLLRHGQGDDALPETLCRRAVEDLPVDGAGISLMTDAGHHGVLAATDGPAQVVEDLQVTTGEGPCLDAWRARRVVLQPDVARVAVTRWPGLGPALLDEGVGAIFAFPLQVGDIRLGVLDLCRMSPGGLDGEQLAIGLAYADAAVNVLLHLQNKLDLGQELDGQRFDPLGGGPQIHQATGMIAVQAAVGLADALLLLRGRAFAQGRSMNEVARDVVNHRMTFDPDSENEAQI